MDLASKINLPFFSWGCQYDRACINYEVVLYFQIGDDQISFHTDNIDDAPEFPHKWNGYEQFKFPMNITKVKKLAKKNGIESKKIKEIESQPLDNETEFQEWYSEGNCESYSDWFDENHELCDEYFY